MATTETVYRSTLNGQSAELERVDAATATYRLVVDGISQSQVCLSDPTVIEFDYARHIARFADGMLAAAAGPHVMHPTIAHLGGGGLTLPRYVATTEPSAVQYVVESETTRTTDLLGILPLPPGSDVRFHFGDARAVVDGDRTPAGPWRDAEVTIVDLWAGSSIAARVASLEFYAGLERLMAPGGGLAVNLIDGPGFAWSRRQAAAIRTLFDHVAVAIDERMLAERLIGNVLVFASHAPLAELTQPGWPQGDANPPRVLFGEALASWIGDAQPVTDSDATDSPPPRESSFAEYAGDTGGHVGTLGGTTRHLD